MNNDSINTNSTNPDLIKGLASTPPPKPNTGNQSPTPTTTTPNPKK
jgi:hypothetical protein